MRQKEIKKNVHFGEKKCTRELSVTAKVMTLRWQQLSRLAPLRRGLTLFTRTMRRIPSWQGLTQLSFQLVKKESQESNCFKIRKRVSIHSKWQPNLRVHWIYKCEKQKNGLG